LKRLGLAASECKTGLSTATGSACRCAGILLAGQPLASADHGCCSGSARRLRS